MSSPEPRYELLYHPGIPGRGEFLRLAFAASKLNYTDVANEGNPKQVYSTCGGERTESADGEPPVFSPPALRIVHGNRNSAASSPAERRVQILSQTANILSYIGSVTGLDGGEQHRYHVAQVAMTALDLTDEVHDTHHPIAVMKSYEEQRDAAAAKAGDFRDNRIPKFLSYFDRVLRGNEERSGGSGRYLVGDRLTYADTTVWQALDGLLFAFPNEMQARKGEFGELLGRWHDELRREEWLQAYLPSKRRLEYGGGIWRRYPELDRQ